MCASLLLGRVSKKWTRCESQWQPELSQHPTSDPPAFWEQVKFQLIVLTKKGCLPRTPSPSIHINIDRGKKNGDGIFIIYDHKEDVDYLFIFFTLLLVFLRSYISTLAFPDSMLRWTVAGEVLQPEEISIGVCTDLFSFENHPSTTDRQLNFCGQEEIWVRLFSFWILKRNHHAFLRSDQLQNSSIFHTNVLLRNLLISNDSTLEKVRKFILVVGETLYLAATSPGNLKSFL